MANNYVSTSFVVPATEAEKILFTQCLDVIDREESDESHYAAEPEEFRAAFASCEDFTNLFDADWLNLGCEHVEIREDGIWMAGDDCHPENMAVLIQAVCKSVLPFAFGYAYTSSKFRLDEFGGGYMLMTKDGISGSGTYEMMYEAVQNAS